MCKKLKNTFPSLRNPLGSKSSGAHAGKLSKKTNRPENMEGARLSPANTSDESISQRHLLCFSMINLNKIPSLGAKTISHDEWRFDVRQIFLRVSRSRRMRHIFKLASHVYSSHCCAAPAYTCYWQLLRGKKFLLILTRKAEEDYVQSPESAFKSFARDVKRAVRIND